MPLMSKPHAVWSELRKKLDLLSVRHYVSYNHMVNGTLAIERLQEYMYYYRYFNVTGRSFFVLMLE